MAEAVLLNDNTAENAILSALISGTEVDYILSELTPDDFSGEKSAFVFRTVQEMRGRGEKVDVVTSLPRITSAGIVSPNEYMQIIQMAVFRGEVESYIKRLKDATKRKEIFRIVTAAEESLREKESPDVIIKALSDAILLRSDTGAKRSLITPEELAMGTIEAVNARMDKDKRAKTVINTSFSSVNRALGGLELSELVIVSAESGAGKSAFSMNLARDVGVTQKRPCAYINSELSTEQQQLRWASFLSGVSHSAIRAGEVSEKQYNAILQNTEGLYKSKLYTYNMPDMQICSVLSEIRLLHKRFAIQMVIVDYIGRMDTMQLKETMQEWQLMKNAARMLKTLAQELNIVVIMVAQLTKDGQSLAHGSYMMHEADTWLNIRRWKEQSDLQRHYPWNCLVEVRKARNADSAAGFRMHFHGDTLTFTDKEEIAEKYCAMEEQQRSAPQSVKDVPL